MPYDSNQPIPELCELQLSSSTNLLTMLCLSSYLPKVFILIITLMFRPPNGRGRPFLWVANSFQASKISICTLFQSRPSNYQGKVFCLLGVKSNQKVTSGKPSKIPVHSYYLGNITLMPLSQKYQFPLGLLFFTLIDILLIAHSPS